MTRTSIEMRRLQAANRQRKHRANLNEQIKKEWGRFERDLAKQASASGFYLPGETIFDYAFYSELKDNYLATSTISAITHPWWDIDLTEMLFCAQVKVMQPVADELKKHFSHMLHLRNLSVRELWFLLCLTQRTLFMFERIGETHIGLQRIMAWSPFLGTKKVEGAIQIPEKELAPEHRQIFNEIVKTRLIIFNERIRERLGSQLTVKDNAVISLIFSPSETEAGRKLEAFLI